MGLKIDGLREGAAGMGESGYIEISEGEFLDAIGPLDVCVQIPENEYSYRTGIQYFKMRWGNVIVGYIKWGRGHILPKYYPKGATT